MEPLTLDAALFPAGVFVRALRLDASGEVPGDIAIPEVLANAVPKRRVEFAAGRLCAREALRLCAPAVAEEVVAIGAQREPCWPAGVVGAIAHTNGYAAAAVARNSQMRGVGLDIERWMDALAPSRIGSKILQDDELRGLVAQTQWAPAEVLTMVFSVKESLYKCLYPDVQRYFGFLDAWVARIEPENGAISLRLTASLTAMLPAGRVFEARFERRDDVVVTAIAVPTIA